MHGGRVTSLLMITVMLIISGAGKLNKKIKI